MRVLFLTKYSPAGASSRYRCYQFAALLRRRGHIVKFNHLLGDDYVSALYSSRKPSAASLALAFLRRLRAVTLGGKYDVVVLQCEAFPTLPTVAERLLFVFTSNVILDIDDAWYEKYAGKPRIYAKFPWLIGRSQAVVAGSRVLARFALQFNENVIMIPTVVDITKYQSKMIRNDRQTLEIVWIGSPLNSDVLSLYQSVWRQLSTKYANILFKFIGVPNTFRLDGVRFRIVPWSESTEAQEICSADIGIMPLRDDPFDRGKCALKIIQYMAAGLPVVASAIGANVDVVQEGETGFLVTSEDDWITALSILIHDASLRQRMGEKGRSRATQHYSIAKVFPTLERVLQGVATST